MRNLSPSLHLFGRIMSYFFFPNKGRKLLKATAKIGAQNIGVIQAQA